MKDRIGDHAVVLGASMAGVLAARALADRYDRVTVVERDRLPEVGMGRRGVPQGRHIHAVQPSGRRAIEELFPGATAELVEQGALSGDVGRDGVWCFAGNIICDGDYGLELLTVSRPLLEGHLRSRLVRLPNVELMEECDVHGLSVDATGSRVTGARVRRRRDGSTEETLPADLVVDATGRGSRMPRWLQDVGFPVPEDEETGLDVSYTTCRFPREPTDEELIIITSAVAPEGRRGGGAIAVEGDSWMVTLGGVLGEHAPTDPEGFVDYAATLPLNAIHELIRDREPLSEPVLMRYPTARRRHYERLERFPERLVVLGDALCSFNPVYGQGMSVAASEAVTLRDCLDTGVADIGPRFFAATRSIVGDAWGMAADGDAQYVSDPTYRPSLPARLVKRYQERLMRVARHDPVVGQAFMAVLGMVARPPSLLHPRIALRVLAGPVRARRPSTPVATRSPAALSER